MPLVALLFLGSALLIMARIPGRRFQAVWLGLILLTFGGGLLGLLNLITRFGNYRLEGLILDLLPINYPGWAWRMLARFSLYDFMRFRLWCVFGFLVAETGFVLSYTRDKRLSRGDWILATLVMAVGGLLIWNYDPDTLFNIYKSGIVRVDSIDRGLWENQLRHIDTLFFMVIAALLLYLTARLGWMLLKVRITQKRVQVMLVGAVNFILCSFFVILFCLGGGSVLNTYTMATTLLPVTDYPEFDITYLRFTPFVALGVLTLGVLLISRYGFLGQWQIGVFELERQIKLANQAVRLTLHSFKNRFLAIQMGMNLAQISLKTLEGEEIRKALTQIQGVEEICREAMGQLDILHIHSGRLQARPDTYSWEELLEEAVHRCAYRLSSIRLLRQLPQEKVLIWADRESVVALLENLLQNSLDALVEVKRPDFYPTVIVEIGRDYEWGYLRMIDNGTGIPKNLMRRVFRPFFTTKSTKTNWGMGLAFCHRVIKAHRGYLNIYSREGEGTTVEVVMRSP